MAGHPRLRVMVFFATLGPAVGWLLFAVPLASFAANDGFNEVDLLPMVLLLVPASYFFGLIPALAAGGLYLLLTLEFVGAVRSKRWYPIVAGAVAGACGGTLLLLLGVGESPLMAGAPVAGAASGVACAVTEKRSRSPVLYDSLLAMLPIIVLVWLAIFSGLRG